MSVVIHLLEILIQLLSKVKRAIQVPLGLVHALDSCDSISRCGSSTAVVHQPLLILFNLACESHELSPDQGAIISPQYHILNLIQRQSEHAILLILILFSKDDSSNKSNRQVQRLSI